MTSGWNRRRSGRRRAYAALLVAGLMRAAAAGPGVEPTDSTLHLATRLDSEGNREAAAIEFRRLALDTPAPAEKAAYFWTAAHEYTLARQFDLSDRMLDRAEDADPSITETARLLRGENATAGRRWPEAAFYFGGLAASTNAPDQVRFAVRRLAVSALHQGDPGAAELALRASPGDESAGLAAVSAYRRGRDKRPMLGGVLGLVPGLGYAYSGEYANAGRSLLLNGLFIFGMVKSADDEQWGAFAAISFFEITWYSGSIYGGVDAAHRYNRDRLDDCAGGIMGAGRYAPDLGTLPVLSVRYTF